MPRRSSELSFWSRVFVYTLGASLGVFAVLYYLSEQQRQRMASRKQGRQPVPRPDQAITLVPPATPLETQAVPVPLTLKASPPMFSRRKAGTICAETLPGTACTIKARYSTGRAPGSLSSEPVTAGDDGNVEWTWDVGTSGDRVDIEVRAVLEGYSEVAAKLRVSIVD